MDISKTNDHIQINIKMPNPSQEPSASSKPSNEYLKYMDIFCTFKIKIESQYLDHGYIKDQWPYPNQDQDAKPSQEPPASSKARFQDLKNMGVLCIFNIKIESQNFDNEYINDQWLYLIQDQDAKPVSGTTSVLQSPNLTRKNLNPET